MKVKLGEHFESSVRNMKYVYRLVQNDIINSVGNVNRGKILNGAKNANPFLVRANETSDVTSKEQLSLSSVSIMIIE